MNTDNAKSVHSAHPCVSPFGQQSCAKWISLEMKLSHFVKGEFDLKPSKTKAA